MGAVIGLRGRTAERLNAVTPGGTALFRTAFPGGGGQSANDVSPFNQDHVICGTDTGGVRLSLDGIASTIVHASGFNKLRSRQTDGVRWSRINTGRVFMTCGDGTTNVGGVYVAEGCDTADPTNWKRLDGVVTGSSQLIFDGGNNETGTQYPPTPYPRHYGNILEIDESSIPNHTLIHVATTTDGAWRIKMRNSDLTAIEQVQYVGTAGLYVRSLRMQTYAPNAAANAYARIILSTYHETTPTKPRLCTNANAADPVATPLATTSMTGASIPSNVENIGYIKTAAGQPVTIFAAKNYVGMSLNAWSAAAASITCTAVTGGPETTERWISVGTTHTGTTYVVLVGTFGGVGSGGGSTGSYNTVWRGTWVETSTTPWSAVSWTALSGSSRWSEQILNKPGVDNEWWLSGSNTPGMNSSAAVSGFATSATNPARMYAVSRGNAYISDDHGANWYASRTWGSADHSSVYCYRAPERTQTFVTTTGDWPLAYSPDEFRTEPKGVRHGFNSNTCFEDYKTGECFIGGGTAAGTVAPAVDNGNTLWGLPYASLSTPVTGLSGMTDYNLNTGSGANTSVGQPMTGVCVYNTQGTGATRTIMVGCMGGTGMWQTSNEGTTWTQVLNAAGTPHPFTTQGGFDNGLMFWDAPRDTIYIMDRGLGRVWRCTVGSGGVISTAVCIFADTWTYNAADDGIGYIDVDEANDRLWVATANGVWYINTASSVGPSTTKTNAVATPMAAQYPGEIVGPMAFLPTFGTVVVATMGLNSAQNMVYPKNGTDGARFLSVSDPTVDSSWLQGTVADWDVSRDRGYKLGFIAPHGLTRNASGSRVYVTMQGNGVGMWTVG